MLHQCRSSNQTVVFCVTTASAMAELGGERTSDTLLLEGWLAPNAVGPDWFPPPEPSNIEIVPANCPPQTSR